MRRSTACAHSATREIGVRQVEALWETLTAYLVGFICEN